MGVGDGLRGGDEHRLLDVGLGEGEAASGEEVPQPLLGVRIDVHLLAQGEGDRLAGEVVLGGAEAAGDEDEPLYKKGEFKIPSLPGRGVRGGYVFI